MSRYQAALWRPLPDRKAAACSPRILVFHTMGGFLRGSESTFAHSALESHFGVGGPDDPAGLDGVVYQWEDTHRRADAQGAGNPYCTSVETSDGRHPEHPWSPKQVDALVALTVWWCRTHGAPARLVRSTAESGIGYHALFPAWNKNAHACPGPVRVRQLVTEVIPRAAAILAGRPLASIPEGDEFDVTCNEKLDALAVQVADIRARLDQDVALDAETNERTKRFGIDFGKIKSKLGIGS